MTGASPLSIHDQIAHMRDDYPHFSVLHEIEWGVVWRGELRPLAQSYSVQISYCAFSFRPADITARRAQVEISNPELRFDASGFMPHIYPNSFMPTRPRLCLHRPEEWRPTMVIADTIVPWTVEWLIAYEGWRATGCWSAGGHNTERAQLT
jgi:hypothetical protein